MKKNFSVKIMLFAYKVAVLLIALVAFLSLAGIAQNINEMSKSPFLVSLSLFTISSFALWRLVKQPMFKKMLRVENNNYQDTPM